MTRPNLRCVTLDHLTWYDTVRLVLYLTEVVILLQVVKLLFTNNRWRHPLTHNTPMYLSLFMLLLSSAIARVRNIGSGPPNWWGLWLSLVATLLIIVWLFNELEFRPAWLQRRRRARHGGRRGAARRRQSDARS
jgi:hypothetical protein